MEQVLDMLVLIIALLAVITGLVVLMKMYREEIQEKEKPTTLVNTTFPKLDETEEKSDKKVDKSTDKVEAKGAKV